MEIDEQVQFSLLQLGSGCEERQVVLKVRATALEGKRFEGSNFFTSNRKGAPMGNRVVGGLHTRRRIIRSEPLPSTLCHHTAVVNFPFTAAISSTRVHRPRENSAHCEIAAEMTEEEQSRLESLTTLSLLATLSCPGGTHDDNNDEEDVVVGQQQQQQQHEEEFEWGDCVGGNNSSTDDTTPTAPKSKESVAIDFSRTETDEWMAIHSVIVSHSHNNFQVISRSQSTRRGTMSFVRRGTRRLHIFVLSRRVPHWMSSIRGG